jgi:SagB-type dehydrogenase family enzyme
MPDAPASPLHLAFSAGVHLEPGATGLQLRRREGLIDLGSVPASLQEALALLSGPGATEEALAGRVAQAGTALEVAHLHVLLDRLARRGLLRYVIRGARGVVMATLEPLSARFELSPQPPTPQQPLRLSRFAHVRREGKAMVLESPRAHARVVLGGAAALGLLAALAEPASTEAAVEPLPRRDRPPARALVRLLARSGFLLEVAPDGATEEERHPALARWEFHDLLFHASSRRALHGRRIGATWRLPDPSLPAVSPTAGTALELPRPDLARLTREDAPLAEVMERRRSLREPGERPLSLAQLAELLYRCVRVREVLPGERDELSSRPYPSGGARYPLEVYASVRQCEGLEPGLYRYDPLGHRLERRSGLTPAVESLLTETRLGAHPPQVLLTLAARFARTSSKYESIAYTLILKEAGVLLQSFSLAATAMGLAACPVGWGDPDTFERAAGTDGAGESSVAELALSSSPAASP